MSVNCPGKMKNIKLQDENNENCSLGKRRRENRLFCGKGPQIMLTPGVKSGKNKQNLKNQNHEEES